MRNLGKDFLHYRLFHDHLSTSTINQSISLFKLLQVDIFGREWEQIRIKRPRREKKLPMILSLEEVERLINAPNNIKHRAILALAYSAGLRRQEIQMIKPSHIDSRRMQVIVVQGKGKKDRLRCSVKFSEVYCAGLLSRLFATSKWFCLTMCLILISLSKNAT